MYISPNEQAFMNTYLRPLQDSVSFLITSMQ